eukprot:SAG31_NODE_795_length_12036_cov_28.879953_5_plen_191_part_00
MTRMTLILIALMVQTGYVMHLEATVCPPHFAFSPHARGAHFLKPVLRAWVSRYAPQNQSVRGTFETPVHSLSATEAAMDVATAARQIRSDVPTTEALRFATVPQVRIDLFCILYFVRAELGSSFLFVLLGSGTDGRKPARFSAWSPDCARFPTDWGGDNRSDRTSQRSQSCGYEPGRPVEGASAAGEARR